MTKLIKIGIAAILLLLPLYVFIWQKKEIKEFNYNTEIKALEKEIEIKEAVLNVLEEEGKTYLQKAKSGEMDKDNADMMIELTEDKKKNLIIHVRRAKERIEKLKNKEKTEPES